MLGGKGRYIRLSFAVASAQRWTIFGGETVVKDEQEDTREMTRGNDMGKDREGKTDKEVREGNVPFPITPLIQVTFHFPQELYLEVFARVYSHDPSLPALPQKLMTDSKATPWMVMLKIPDPLCICTGAF